MDANGDFHKASIGAGSCMSCVKAIIHKARRKREIHDGYSLPIYIGRQPLVASVSTRRQGMGRLTAAWAPLNDSR